MLSGSDTSKSFEMNYLNPIKTALFNAGKDDLGVAFLKERLKEVRFAFHTHGWTSFSQNIKVVDRVLLVPGIQPEDNTSYCGGVQQFIEKHL